LFGGSSQRLQVWIGDPQCVPSMSAMSTGHFALADSKAGGGGACGKRPEGSSNPRNPGGSPRAAPVERSDETSPRAVAPASTPGASPQWTAVRVRTSSARGGAALSETSSRGGAGSRGGADSASGSPSLEARSAQAESEPPIPSEIKKTTFDKSRLDDKGSRSGERTASVHTRPRAFWARWAKSPSPDPSAAALSAPERDV